MRARIAFLALLICVAPNAWSHAATPDLALTHGPVLNQKEVTVALGNTPGPFDPATSSGVEQMIVVRPCYQSLVRREISVTGQMRYVPDLAENWKLSEDKLSVTLKLRADAKFDDGSPVDAKAVEFTYMRLVALGRGPGSLIKQLFAKVDAIDKYTVKVTLRNPTSLFLLAMSEKGAVIVNPRIPGALDPGDWGSKWLANNSAGSGPWRLQKSVAKGYWTLERNSYWNGHWGENALEKVNFREIRDPSVRLLALQKGDVDLALGISIQDLAEVQKDRTLTLLSGPVSAFSNLALNTSAGPLRDKRLRLAIGQALNTKEVTANLRDGHASEFIGPLPTDAPGAVPDSYMVRFAPEKARKTIKELQAENFRFDLVYPGLSPATDTLAQYIQASLADVGLTVRLQRLALPAFIDRVNRGSFDIALMGWVADSSDPASIVNVWFGTDRIGAAGNYARYQDVQTQKLLDASLTITDAKTRAETIAAAVRRVNAEVPYIHLFQTHNWIVHKVTLTGVDFNSWDLFRLKPENWEWSKR